MTYPINLQDTKEKRNKTARKNEGLIKKMFLSILNEINLHLLQAIALVQGRLFEDC